MKLSYNFLTKIVATSFGLCRPSSGQNVLIKTKMPLYTMYCSSVSWDPIYSRTALYQLMPAVVVLSVVSLTNIVHILLKY